ncbi:MAG: hypothetical protein WBW04_19580 [Nitrolancea sp.]
MRSDVKLSRRGLSSTDAVRASIPLLLGIVWALIAVDLTFLLEIDWSPPQGAVESISYVLQVILFWPSAVFTLATRALPLIGWQPGWAGLTFVAIVCGGVPGLLVGLILVSWSRR